MTCTQGQIRTVGEFLDGARFDVEGFRPASQLIGDDTAAAFQPAMEL